MFICLHLYIELHYVLHRPLCPRIGFLQTEQVGGFLVLLLLHVWLCWLLDWREDCSAPVKHKNIVQELYYLN